MICSLFSKSVRVLLLAAFGMASHAETIPPAGEIDPRIRVVAYNSDDVVKLRGFVGYQIHMQWAEGEEFVNLGAGDVGGFDIGTERNHFFIKPKQELVATNLTVLTNRRAYHFEYTATKLAANRTAPRDMVYSVRFVYPQDEARMAAAELERRKTEAKIESAVAQRVRNIDYWFCGSKTLKPLTAYDDGVQTRLRFPARAEFPAIFVKNDDDSESLINFNIENNEDVVIHKVARRFVLRRGNLVGCVVNQAFDGGGERLDTNTVVPGVRRETKGVAP